MTHSQGSWSPRNLLKGLIGESTVADVMERSMFQAFGCFVANDVPLPNTGGNIDHLVITPQLVLVVETKYGRVNHKYFPGVLEGIARKVELMQGYLGSEIEVKGCLAFADSSTKVKPTYRTPRGQEILSFVPTTLKQFLFQECSKPRTLSREALRKVAGMGFDAEE